MLGPGMFIPNPGSRVEMIKDPQQRIEVHLKVPKCEIFDRSDFHDFYSIKPFWVGDFGAKI
jgi:hypothetical protein